MNVARLSVTSSPDLFPLLPDEKVVTTMDGESLVVTTCRVRSYGSTLGRSSMTSLMLEEIASCRVTAMTRPWLLVIAALATLGGLASTGNSSNVLVIAVLIALVCVVAYFLTRRHFVAISSAAAAIHVDIGGATASDVRELIDAIELAKDARYRLLARA